jgi:predicted Rossmann-fold nucleotide-binding protein
MFGREYWERAVDFQFLADSGTIDDADLDLFRFAETAEEGWNMIQQYHRRLSFSGEKRTGDDLLNKI